MPITTCFVRPRRLCACFSMLCLLAVWSPAASRTEVSEDEETLWKLERAYWHFVESNDLAAYRNLWHENFLGWPSVSSTPVRKDHITDWITSQTGKGLAFKAGEFKPAAVQVTGDVAFACYWITLKWVDPQGNGEAHTFRITHAWVRNGRTGKSSADVLPESDKPAG